MLIEYNINFRSNHLKYFNKEIWIFIFKLKKELKKLNINKFYRLPKTSQEFTVIKSPTVMKSFREQFKINRYSTTLKVLFKVTPQQINLLDTAIKLVILTSLKAISLNIKIAKKLKK